MEKKTKMRVWAFFCMLLFPALTFAQIMVKGTIKGEDGYGMPGANVSVKGETTAIPVWQRRGAGPRWHRPGPY